MELHVITLCVVLSTVFLGMPSYREAKRQFVNWLHRRAAHREYIRQLERGEK